MYVSEFVLGPGSLAQLSMSLRDQIYSSRKDNSLE